MNPHPAPTMTPQAFIDRWQDNELTERAGAQAHFDDLCDLLGVEKPRDPERYCFEKGAKKAGGGDYVLALKDNQGTLHEDVRCFMEDWAQKTGAPSVCEKDSVERRYYLSSLPPDAELIGRRIQAYWGIENSLHWVLDMDFHEDQSRVRTGHAAENLAIIRRFALNLLRHDMKKEYSAVALTLDAENKQNVILSGIMLCLFVWQEAQMCATCQVMIIS